MQYIVVVHCVVGSIKQFGGDDDMHDFYTMSADGMHRILNHTKEVSYHKNLITGSDSQSACTMLSSRCRMSVFAA